jgi:hypothetical protein
MPERIPKVDVDKLMAKMDKMQTSPEKFEKKPPVYEPPTAHHKFLSNSVAIRTISREITRRGRRDIMSQDGSITARTS